MIADKAEIIGTMRSFSDANYEMMKQRMHAVAEAIAQMFNVEVELVIDDFYAVVNNDEKLTAMLAGGCRRRLCRNRTADDCRGFLLLSADRTGSILLYKCW